jgi:hypothetical protein
VGTPSWSQKVESVIDNAITDPNVGYVLHFYSASHPLSNWKSNIDKARSNNLPIFVTEYGTTTSDGGCSPAVTNDCSPDKYDSHNVIRSNEWYNYLDEKRISSVAWNINDKYEGASFFGTVPRGTFDQTVDANWADTTKMNESGKYIFKKLNCYYLSLPWNPTPGQSGLGFDPCQQTTPIKTSVASKGFGFELSGAASLTVNLLEPAHLVIEVFSMQGQKMGEIFRGHQNAGTFQFSFANLNLKNGVYIFNLRQNSAIQTKKLRIIR